MEDRVQIPRVVFFLSFWKSRPQRLVPANGGHWESQFVVTGQPQHCTTCSHTMIVVYGSRAAEVQWCFAN
jgi:hypothetical protein